MSDPWRAWLHGDHARLWPRPALPPLRHAPFALFLVGILGYGAAFGWYMLARFDFFNMLCANYDDAFYYFQIAYHMAEGRFSTFDGGLTRTNGYHPLWLFLITPVYWVFDKTEALFAIKAFEVALITAGVALAAVAVRVARLPWILLFGLLPALFAQDGMLVGLEAALVLFMLGLLMLAMCLFARDPVRWRWPLAAVAFALPWVRLEWAAVAVAATAALGFLEWSGWFPGHLRTLRPDRERPRSSSRPAARALSAAAPLAGALAGVLVYFAYNGILFGGIVPVSGAVKAFWSQRAWDEEGGYDLAASFKAFSQSEAFDEELLTALEVVVYALLVWCLSRSSRRREDALLLACLAGASALAAGHLAKFALSVVLMHPDGTDLSFLPSYFVPAYLMEALVVLLRCCVGIYLLRRFVAPRLPRTADVLRLAGIGAAALALAAQADFAKPFRDVDTARDGVRLADWNARIYMAGEVMNRLLPEGTLVGSWNSGVLGYFSRLQVMNLDGLVNSYDYKHAMEETMEGGGQRLLDLPEGLLLPRNREFWRRQGLFYFADPLFLYDDPLFHGADSEEVSLLFKGQRYNYTQYGGLWVKLFSTLRDSADRISSPGAWFRERMAPHLEYQADGIGLLVEGRSVRAFAWDCTVDDNEVAAWIFDGKVGAVSRWEQTADGACISGILLQHGHQPALRVQRVALSEAAVGLVGGRPPAIPAGANGFDVHLVADALVYVKTACEQADVEAPFYLHIVPVGDDFDDGREALGYNNLDFKLGQYVEWFGDLGGKPCLAVVPLPHYRIAKIRTGQYGIGDMGIPWAGTVNMVEEVGEILARLVGGPPPVIAADSAHPDAPLAKGFDVYLADDALVFVKAVCGPANVEAPFFLHVVPVGDDFDDGREAHGFNSLDFMLRQYVEFGNEGADGPCLAEVPLPGYRIAKITTGQYMGSHRVWEGEIRIQGASR